MSVNLRSLSTHRIVDFSGGINEFDSSFTMENSELQEATNVELRTGGAIRTRKGSPIYQRQAFQSFTVPFTTMFRYSRFDGTKKVLACSSDRVIDDDDNGEFGSQTFGPLGSDDGKIRFAQWREAVFFSTKGFNQISGGLYAYDSNLFPRSRFLNVTSPGTITGRGQSGGIQNGGVTITGVNSANGVLVGGAASVYVYRFTLDVYHGNTFLGESGVIWDTAFGPGFFDQLNPTIGAGNDAYEIRCNAALGAFVNNQTVGAVNIYRTIQNYTSPAILFGNQAETNMVFVGSIPRSKWGDTSTVQILDEGLFAGRSIAPFYNRLTVPPYGRYLVVHKSRVWIANVKYEAYIKPLFGETIVTDTPHRIYFSEVNEPAVFLSTSWVEMDPTDGDGITGIVSFKNKVLIVFQANSIWAISGGDDESNPGVPDISIENISTDVGCVAPESIQTCEGKLVWLSHRGIYSYDGTIPKPLNTENIDSTILDLRPVPKYDDPASVFLSKEREYWISHASIDVNPLYQTLISKYSFKNDSWVRADHGTRGIASFLEKRDMNRPPILLAGIEASSSDMGADTAVRRMEYGGYDSASTPISWAWKSKFFDLGKPYMDKKFIAVLVQLESETDVTLQVSCDNHLVDEPFTVLKTENDQDADLDDLVWANDAGSIGTNWSNGTTDSDWPGDNQRNALIYLNDKCWGKRIALRFSGSTTASPTEIQAVTFFYDPKEGVRQ